MNEFEDRFPHLIADGKQYELLKRAVGRKVVFNSFEKGDGEIHRKGVFEVIGVQMTHDGDYAFRVVTNDDDFGLVMNINRAKFI